MVGYPPPSVADARQALREVVIARASIPDGRVIVQTDLGDVSIPRIDLAAAEEPTEEALSSNTLKDQVLIIESAVFKDGNPWRFSDGAASSP